MTAAHPQKTEIPALRALWYQAFGDEADFLDPFFRLAFSPERCLRLGDREPEAVLYWFDMTLNGQKWAYLYAVATREDCRGRGLCRELMTQTHAHLAARGYSGTVLVPQEQPLADMYAKFGYRYFCTVAECTACASESPVPLHAVGAEEYALARRALAPQGSFLQEGGSLRFQASQMEFWTGEGLLLTGSRSDGVLTCPEYLGDPNLLPGILAALNCRQGSFRSPGNGRPFAMFRPLHPDAAEPKWFAIAFD